MQFNTATSGAVIYADSVSVVSVLDNALVHLSYLAACLSKEQLASLQSFLRPHHRMRHLSFLAASLLKYPLASLQLFLCPHHRIRHLSFLAASLLTDQLASLQSFLRPRHRMRHLTYAKAQRGSSNQPFLCSLGYPHACSIEAT